MRSASFLFWIALAASLYVAAADVRFLSFDASLMLGVDKYSLERVDNINYELALLSLEGLPDSVDAMCLQGYYLPYQVQKLIGILSRYLPYYYVPPPSNGTCFCQPAELAGMNACLGGCAALTDPVQQQLCGSGCLSNPAVLGTLSQVCQNCITGHMSDIITSRTTIEQALTQCAMASMSGASGADCYAYGGYSGNVLFSRTPLTNPMSHNLTFVPNAFYSDAIYARASYGSVKDLHLLCTQFMPMGPDQDENTTALLVQVNGAQTLSLATLIGTVAGDPTQKVVLMGNLKQSPDMPEYGIEPLASTYFAAWQAQGFVEPALSSNQTTKCTYCDSNSLTAFNYLSNTMSSHILLRGFSTANTNIQSIEAAQTLTTKTTILDMSVPATIGTAQSVPYSPNYAVAVQVSTMSSASMLVPAWFSVMQAVVTYFYAL